MVNSQHGKENGCHIPGHFPIYIRKSTFRLPFKFQTPIIMIGMDGIFLD
jgi:sulfite reductase alpha subunit-like flavoprotein